MAAEQPVPERAAATGSEPSGMVPVGSDVAALTVAGPVAPEPASSAPATSGPVQSGTGVDGHPNRALVLNATFEPLAIVSSRRAFLLVLATKAEMVHSTGRSYRSVAASFPEPSVVRLSRFVRVPADRTVALNRVTLFARDHHKCQYCGLPADSIDHVIPKSRGGAHAWENVVAACKRCNMRKQDRLPHEAGFVLARKPFAPRRRVWLLAMSRGAPSEWEPYLGDGTLTRLPA